jgi:hypothetical protein
VAARNRILGAVPVTTAIGGSTLRRLLGLLALVTAAVAARSAGSRLPRSAVDRRLPANAAMLAATAPLAGGTVYHVRICGYVQATAGGPWTRFRTRAWSFTTA